MRANVGQTYTGSGQTSVKPPQRAGKPRSNLHSGRANLGQTSTERGQTSVKPPPRAGIPRSTSTECVQTCFAPRLYNESLKTECENRSFSLFSIPVSHQSYIMNSSKPDPEIIHFVISDICFAPKLYKESFKTGSGDRSFSLCSTPASQQRYIKNRSKPGSEIYHFRHF